MERNNEIELNEGLLQQIDENDYLNVFMNDFEEYQSIVIRFRNIFAGYIVIHLVAIVTFHSIQRTSFTITITSALLFLPEIILILLLLIFKRSFYLQDPYLIGRQAINITCLKLQPINIYSIILTIIFTATITRTIYYRYYLFYIIIISDTILFIFCLRIFMILNNIQKRLSQLLNEMKSKNMFMINDHDKSIDQYNLEQDYRLQMEIKDIKLSHRVIAMPNSSFQSRQARQSLRSPKKYDNKYLQANKQQILLYSH